MSEHKILDSFQAHGKTFIVMGALVNLETIKCIIEEAKRNVETPFLVLDFQNTQTIDPKFYNILYKLKLVLSKVNGFFVSKNLSDELVKQIGDAGVSEHFNIDADKELTASSGDEEVFKDLIGVYSASTVSVFGMQLGVEVSFSEPFQINGQKPPGFEIASVINFISNKFNGGVALCFEETTYLKLCTDMFGEEQTEMNEENEDAAGEFLNIIFGVAKSELVDKSGYEIEKAIPTTFRGDNIKIISNQVASHVIPFSCAYGNFHIEIYKE